MKNLTTIQTTMKEQIDAMFNPLAQRMLGLKMILKDGENKLRYHFKKGSKVINVDVEYDYGQDAYKIAAYKINGAETKKIYENSCAYFDDFGAIFGDILEVKEE